MRLDLGFLRLAVALGPLAGENRALGGAPAFDLLLLGEPRIFGVAVDLERYLFASRFLLRIWMRGSARCRS